MDRNEIKSIVLFAKYRLWRRNAIAYYRAIVRNEHLSPDELDAINWEKTKALLSYAYEKVPFYRKKFVDAGLHPNDLVDRDDYEKVPRLTTRELRHNFKDLLSVDANPRFFRESSTGGSTGVPVRVMVDKRIPQEAYMWRVMRWWHLTPGVDAAFVWRLIRKKLADKLLYSIAHWPTRTIFLDASCITEEAMQDFIARFNRVRPALLQGYVGAIYELALYIQENRITIQAPKAIWVTSSPVTVSQRRRIEAVFRGPVYDQYGCGEVSWLSAQCCEKTGLHIFHDTRRIEFVDEAGHSRPTGQLGRVVITNLDNHLFPIIRYENGDMGRALAGTCRCGLSLPLMDTVNGRTTDVIRLPGRAYISGDYLTTIFDDYPGAVKAFQVRQQSDYSISVKYVPDSSGEELARALKRVKEELIRRTMSRVPISLEAVKHIPHDRGKLRFVISEIEQDKSDRQVALH